MDAADELGRADAGRVYWHSRRGMLELDLLLMPFAKSVYPRLDHAGQSAYKALLACEDTDLYRWLVVADRPVPEQLNSIILQIVRYGKAHTTT